MLFKKPWARALRLMNQPPRASVRFNWQVEELATELIGAQVEMNIVPVGDNLVIKRLEAEETTAGGIVLPDAAREQPQQGKVLSVGDGPLLPSGERAKSEVQEGDRVVFGSYAGQEVDIDGEKLLILSTSDVLAIIR
jgi:chaperonin GroES